MQAQLWRRRTRITLRLLQGEAGPAGVIPEISRNAQWLIKTERQASGAQLWASDASADSLASGGDDPDLVLPLRALIWIGVLGYRPPRVDHRFRDGDTIRVGPLALTAHITAGHTRGCTSWSFPVEAELQQGRVH